MPSPSRYVLTGATSGIGAAVADALARRHHALVLVGGSREVLDARGAALRQLGAPAVSLHEADLSSVAQTLALAGDLASEPVDGVYLGAGILRLERQVTAEDLELNYAVNHLHKFILADALGPHLAPRGGRIVVGAPVGAVRGRLDDVHGTGSWSLFQGISTSQYANDVLASGLPGRHPGLEVVGWNPGSTRGTRVTRGLPWWARTLFWLVNLRGRACAEVGEQGADLMTGPAGRPLTWVSKRDTVSLARADELSADVDVLWDLDAAIIDRIRR